MYVSDYIIIIDIFDMMQLKKHEETHWPTILLYRVTELGGMGWVSNSTTLYNWRQLAITVVISTV